MATAWKLSDIPDQNGKVALITGGNTGLGFKTALELARKGASVIIACRSIEKGQDAIHRIRDEVPDAQAKVLSLNLIDRHSIEDFSTSFHREYSRLDLLFNNAGVVNLETLQHTQEGYEKHFATNHLGHFALTGRLFSTLVDTPHARVITLSSGGAKVGTIDFDDLDWHKRPYNRGRCYGDSKLANLLFMRSLQKRFDKAGASALSVAAQPGLTATERQQSIGIGGWLSRWLATPVEQGVRPQLRAATDPNVKPCEYYGPKRLIWGPAVRHTLDHKVLDDEVAERLWSVSEQRTGILFE